ncbi:MAG: PH domain-containing protein [Pseudomonadota bacterium]
MSDAPDLEPRYEEHPKMFADEPGYFVLAVLLIPLVVGIIWLVVWYIKIRCTLVTVNDERILLSSGVFAKRRMEIELESVRTVRIDQTFADRVFNCGVLKVYTSGDQPELVQKGLPDPQRLRTAIRA